MYECFRCGVSSERERLFDAIAESGIVKICEKCSFNEKIPIIRKPTTFQLKEAERKQTVYERLSRAAGIDIEDKKKDRWKGSEELKAQNIGLRDIIERNMKINLLKERELNKNNLQNFVENFHWIIFRERKSKHMTQSQLANAIGESEAAVKMAEKGILPGDDYRLIKKFENYFGIRLRKQEKENFSNDISELEKPVRILSFNQDTIKNLTIADLKEMRRQQKEQRNIEKESLEKDNTEESKKEKIY